jgi:hypothetical protein
MFEVTGLDEFLAKIAKITATFTDAGLAATTVVWADTEGPLIARELMAEAPVGKDPAAGRLRDSIRYQRESAFGVVDLQFHTNVPYAPFVIHGTGPHEIFPVVAQALHWHEEGRDFFAAHVHSPGTSPNDFPQRVLDRMSAEIVASYLSALEASLHGL